MLLYLALLLIASLPSVRAKMAERLSEAISTKIGSRAEIGNVKVDLFNTLTIDSLTIWDQRGGKMMTVGQAVGSVELMPLISSGKIKIANLKIFRGQLNLYRDTPHAQANYQFAIDSLMAKDGKDKGMEVDLRSVVLRDIALLYDVRSEFPNGKAIDINHVDVERLNASLVLKDLDKKQPSVRIRNLALRLRNGMGIEEMRASIVPDGAGNHVADVAVMELRLGNNLLWRAEDTQAVINSQTLSLNSLKLKSMLTAGSQFYDIAANVIKKTDNSTRPIEADMAVSSGSRKVADIKMRCAADIGESFNADVDLHITREEVDDVLRSLGIAMPDNEILNAVEYLDNVGKVDVNHDKVVYSGSVKSNICDIESDVEVRGSNAQYTLNIASATVPSSFKEGNVLQVSDANITGQTACRNGRWDKLLDASLSQIINELNGKVKASVAKATLGDVSLDNINMVCDLNDGKVLNEFSVDDSKLGLHAIVETRSAGETQSLYATVDVDHMKSGELGMRNSMLPTDFSGKIECSADNVFSLPGNFAVKMNDVAARYGNDVHSIDYLSVNGMTQGNAHKYTLDSDVATGEMVTNIPLHRLSDMIVEQISDHLPALNSRGNSERRDGWSYANMQLRMNDLSLMSDVLDLDLTTEEPVDITGFVTDNGRRMSFTLSAPALSIDGVKYEGLSGWINNSTDSLAGAMMMTRYFGAAPVRIENHLSGRDNNIFSEALWKNLKNGNTYGSLKTETKLRRDADNRLAVSTHVLPTNLFIADTAWQISPATLEYDGTAFRIKDLTVSRGEQYVSVNANVGNQEKDLLVELNDVEVAYLLGLTNFKPVSFGGKASGSIKNSAENPNEIHADLFVRDFLFNDASLGVLDAKGLYDIEGSVLSINAKAQRAETDSTLIDGKVKLKDKLLDFHFKSEKTNLQFLNRYVGRFIDDLEGTTSGDFHLFGTFRDVQMEADETINYFAFRPKMLGVLYTMENQPIHIRPDTIDFTGFKVRDPYGNEADVRGSVNHHYLFRFNYDIDFDLHDLMTINWKEENSRAFWGRIFTDGHMNLHGTTRDVHLTGELTSANGDDKSVLYYNSGTYGAVDENKEYIHFVSSRDAMATTGDAPDASIETVIANTGADVRMDIKFNATPDATLNIVTDPVTRDQMSLVGVGPLQLTYYNKGRFALNGLYSVNDGNYKLTIKDIIHKNFDIQSGGYLRFNGAPAEADINLKGVHRVNSVSLSDLNVGASRSNSTVGVDCILNFSGKAADPKVSFDIDFPKANSDENLMLKKFILTEEDRNMQAVYLLSIGRFYTYNYNDFSTNTGGQNQSTVAMTSFLAGTLSGQINNILQDAFHITNWNFGTSVAAGRMGWDDMEVQGSLSGKMFNNRLLFNGNIGYRDQVTTYSNNFIGDFNLQWLLNKSGTISLKAYSETNDRYFTKSSLTTQGGGILFQKDFRKLREFFNK